MEILLLDDRNSGIATDRPFINGFMITVDNELLIKYALRSIVRKEILRHPFSLNVLSLESCHNYDGWIQNLCIDKIEFINKDTKEVEYSRPYDRIILLTTLISTDILGKMEEDLTI